jgi:methyltransferase
VDGTMIFVLLWLVVICQRVIELLIAKSNENWMRKNGAKIVAEGHYKWIVFVHILFLVAVLIEGYFSHQFQTNLNQVLFIMFIIVQLLRIWCLASLGRFWNTKIIVLPNVALIKRGPYKLVKHPNYIIVGMEFVIIPLLFQAYITALVFPLIHIVLMFYRIPMEERALKGLKE